MSDSLSHALSTGSFLNMLANPTQADPVGAMSRGISAARNIYGLRGQQAEEALGQAYAGAVDPQTGRFDPLKFNALAAANPATALALKSGIESSQSLQGAQFNLNSAQNVAVNSALSAALKVPDDQLAQSVVEQTQRLISNGVIPADRAQAVLGGLNGQNPAALRQQLLTMWRGTLPPNMQQEQLQGRPFTQTGPGGVTIGGTQDVSSGAVSSPTQSGVPQGMTPAELNETVKWTDNRKTLPDGSPNPTYGQEFPITKGDMLKLLHPGTAPGGVPGAGNVPGSGRYPPASLRKPGAADQPASTPAGPQPTPGTMQPSPADADLIKQSGPKFQADIETGTAQAQPLATLSTMQSDIGRFTTGTGANKTLDWKRALQSWAPTIAASWKIKPDEIAAQESFDKAVNMIVAQQGAKSDERMNVQMGATPHSTLSPEGVDSIIRQLQGNSDYLVARGKLANAWGNRTDYGGFSSKITDLDPRYFQVQRLTPEQKTAYFNGLKEKERDDFKRSYAKTQALIDGIR